MEKLIYTCRWANLHFWDNYFFKRVFKIFVKNPYNKCVPSPTPRGQEFRSNPALKHLAAILK